MNNRSLSHTKCHLLPMPLAVCPVKYVPAQFFEVESVTL